MRNEMIGAVVRRALEHPEFRNRLLEDPRGALQDHGFVLEDSDMAEIEKVRSEDQLASIAERYGIHVGRA